MAVFQQTLIQINMTFKMRIFACIYTFYEEPEYSQTKSRILERDETCYRGLHYWALVWLVTFVVIAILPDPELGTLRRSSTRDGASGWTCLKTGQKHPRHYPNPERGAPHSSPEKTMSDVSCWKDPFHMSNLKVDDQQQCTLDILCYFECYLTLTKSTV